MKLLTCVQDCQKIEASALKRSLKKSGLKISQHSEENTCSGVSLLIKLQAEGLQLYQKQAPAQVLSCDSDFLKFWATYILKNTYGRLLLKKTSANFYSLLAKLLFMWSQTRYWTIAAVKVGLSRLRKFFPK